MPNAVSEDRDEDDVISTLKTEPDETYLIPSGEFTEPFGLNDA